VKAAQQKFKATPSVPTRSLPYEAADSRPKAHRVPLIAILLLVTTLAVFWRVQNHGFVWDDGVNVERNDYFKPVSLANVARFWRGPFENLYVPLTYTAWGALAYFAQQPENQDGDIALDPRWFHIANIVFHALSALAVFALLRRLVQNDWAASAGAALFAVHPVQVEPVAWVTGLKDVLSGFWSLLALWQYVAFAQSEPASRSISSGGSSTSGSSATRLHYSLATAAFVLALLAKPAAIVVPMMAWVLDDCLIKRPVRRSMLSLAPWLIIALPFVVITKWQQPDNLLATVTPVWERPLVATDALAFYLYKLFLPIWLGPGYARSPELIFDEGWAYFTWIVPVAVGVAIWYWRRYEPAVLAAVGLFVAGLLPVLGLVQFQFQNWSTVADRYLYLSVLGPALAFAALIARVSKKKNWATVACVAILVPLSLKTVSQAAIWNNSRSLWGYAMEIGQDSAVCRSNLAVTLLDSNLEEAVYQLRRAVDLAPAFADAYYNLGLALAKRGEFGAAVENYRTVLRLRPGYPKAHYFLAVALAGSGRPDEAISEYRKALQIRPNDARAHNGLGNLLADRGLVDQAIEHYREAVRIRPNYTGAYFNLGLAYEDRGDLDEAARQYGKALEIDPNNVNARVNLAVILQRQGRRDAAIEHFRAALRIKPDFPEAQRGLARALSEPGNGKVPAK